MKKILRVETNPMMPHEAADRLRMIARELSEMQLDQEMRATSPNCSWSFLLPENDEEINEPMVHFLRSGFPLCKFSTELPANWPDGHKWSDDWSHVNCLDCKVRR